MTVQDETISQEGISLTAKAATKVGSLLEQEGRDDLRLRIAVQPGGCSGLRYQLYFDERQADGDIVHEFSGVAVVTDKMSAPYLAAPPSTSWTRSRSRLHDRQPATGSAPAATPSLIRGGRPVT
jgi:iron-sulfur cluster assembly accessory protein